MYPLFHLGPYIEIHFFGLFLLIAWIVFFWLLHRYSNEHGTGKNIFQNIAVYTVSMFLWGRIFYILSNWRNEKYIFVDLVEGGGIFAFLGKFFITENYNLSFAGGAFGFFLVFFWYLSRAKGKGKFAINIDVIARSFFWAALIGYIGALLGGQIYGIPFDSPFSFVYDNKNSPISMVSPRFPLPILYILLCGAGGFLIEKVRKKLVMPPGFLGYIGFSFFGIALFLFGFLNGDPDMFSSYALHLSLNQIFGLLFTSIGFIGVMRNIKI